MKKPAEKIKNAAVCFSGLAKNFELCYPYIKKNLLDNLKSYDVFCCVEDDENADKTDILDPAKVKKMESSDVDKITASKLKELHKLNYKKFFFPESSKFNLRNVYQQIYKIKECFNLLENYSREKNVSYKYFIRVRFDFLPVYPIYLEKLKIKKNEVIVPFMEKGPEKDQINDMFSVSGDFDAFRSYCSIYDHFGRISFNEIGFNPSKIQRFYFFFEKIYVYSLLFLKGKNKILENILGFLLLLPRKIYKTFKNKVRICLERVLFYHLKSEKKTIREEKIPFIIVRNAMDGLLFIR